MALTTESQARRLMARLDALAAFTDDPPRLTRLCLSQAHRRAAAQFIAWANESGLDAYVDPVGNVRARYEGAAPGAPALMIGSHIDTVRDAGRYDGALGALAALSVVEGLAGVNEPEALEQRDASGVSMREALIAFGGDPDHLAAARAEGVVAFVELHIEQGPVLEAEGRPLGVVTAINGATRLSAVVTGTAGHAGASPMELRRDALAAAAEMILAIEARARHEPELVATVGRLDVEPGAVNVVPGRARFSIDLRAPLDERRRRAVADIAASLSAIAARRGVRLEDRRRARVGGRGGRRRSAPAALRRRPRHDGDGPALAGRDAVRALQGRRQPQPSRVDQPGRLRAGARRADALRRGFPAGVIDGVKARVEFRQVLSSNVKPGA